MKKKIMAMCLVIAMAATAVIGGTLAYFTDTDNETNTFTVGNVKIDLIEQERVEKKSTDGSDYTDNNLKDYPNGEKDEAKNVMPLDEGTNKYLADNYIDKIVTVKNTGASPAYIRTLYAIPVVEGYDEKNQQSDNWLHWNVFGAADYAEKDEGWYWGKLTEENKDQKNKYNDPYAEYPDNVNDWNSVKGEDGLPQIFKDSEGNKYMIYIGTNVNVIDPDETTEPALRGFFLDSKIDCVVNEDGTLNYTITNNQGVKSDLGDISEFKIPVFAQAVQEEGFADAWEAFEKSGLTDNPWNFEKYTPVNP